MTTTTLPEVSRTVRREIDDLMQYEETPALKILRSVRLKLDKPSSWTKGIMHRNGQFCLVGAISDVIGRELEKVPSVDPRRGDYDEVVMALHAAILARSDYSSLWDRGGSPLSTVGLFNDRPDIKHSDIIAVLDKAYELEIRKERGVF